MWGQLISDKDTKTFQWRKRQSFQQTVTDHSISIYKKKKGKERGRKYKLKKIVFKGQGEKYFNPYFISYIKVNSKWITGTSLEVQWLRL